ncbi:MAG: outer membrane beta-barrel protein, partial [Bacteroidales bacterium]|nr:outer membrane beta-barrel protein [Bacteroidales bacterium]
YNGLMKMDGPYNLRTSFSSYQLSENYAVVMTEHFKLNIGIGYESDVYKFTDNYISMDATTGAFVSQDQAGVDAVSGVSGSNLGDWSSRFVTRYVTLPVEFEYRDKSALRSWRIKLGVIPGLSFNSSHTGLKHELEKRGRNYQDVQEDVSKFVNPYKLDVRFTVKWNWLGFFIQLPTMPVFIDTDTKVYPIKLGFML